MQIMNVLKYIVLIVVTCSGLWACYDDKGNYNYRELDKIVIDSTGGMVQSVIRLPGWMYWIFP